MRIALIPVKELSQAKARLAPVLDAAGRRELALAMFRDVLEAALACDAVEGVAVISRDETALSIAEEAGAEPLAEPGGLNEALTSAAEKLRARGVDQLLVLAADLPLVDSHDITTIVEASADIVVVPSLDGGTNALALPPDGIPLRFGPDSAREHMAAAETAGLGCLRLELPALALDIDTPADLKRLGAAVARGEPVGPNTRSFVKSFAKPAGAHVEEVR